MVKPVLVQAKIYKPRFAHKVLNNRHATRIDLAIDLALYAFS